MGFPQYSQTNAVSLAAKPCRPLKDFTVLMEYKLYRYPAPPAPPAQSGNLLFLFVIAP
jgi:hypothetical protein